MKMAVPSSRYFLSILFLFITIDYTICSIQLRFNLCSIFHRPNQERYQYIRIQSFQFFSDTRYILRLCFRTYLIDASLLQICQPAFRSSVETESMLVFQVHDGILCRYKT